MRKLIYVCAIGLAASTAAVGCGSDKTIVRRETVQTQTVPVAPVVTERRTTVEVVPGEPVIEERTTVQPSSPTVIEKRRTVIERD